MSFLTARDSTDPLGLLEVAYSEWIEPKRDENNAKFVNRPFIIFVRVMYSSLSSFVWEMSPNTRQW